MGQVLQGSATTTEAVRRAVERSQECGSCKCHWQRDMTRGCNEDGILTGRGPKTCNGHWIPAVFRCNRNRKSLQIKALKTAQ
jgi:hypothetical protein